MSKISKSKLYLTSFLFSIIILFFGNMELRAYLMWLPLVITICLSILFLMKKLRIKKFFLKVLLINILWIFYALPFSFSVINPDIHIKAILETILYILGLIIIIFYFFNRNVLFEMLTLLINIYIFIAILMLILQIIGLYNVGGAFSSLYSNRNVFAFMSLVFLTIALNTPKIIQKRNKKQVIMLAGLVMLTASTKGLLGIVIVFFIHMLFKYKLKKSLPLLIVFFTVFSCLLLVFNESTERLLKKIDVLENLDADYTADNVGQDSGKIRLFLIIDSIRIILENPITGVGVNNGQYHLTLPTSQKYRMDSLNSQNNITEMFLNVGVPGFILFYFPLFYLLYKSIKIKTKQKEIKTMIVTLVILKLSLDIGMKSYNDVGHVFAIVLSWILFYGYIKNDMLQCKIPNCIKK